MPVLLTGRNLDDVAHSNLLDGVTPSLHAAGAGRDDQDLAAGMRMPRRAGPGSKVTDPPLAWRDRAPRTASRPARCR